MIRIRPNAAALPPVTVEVITDPVLNARLAIQMERFKKNSDWLNAHAEEVYSHRGKFVCIAGQELFVGDDVLEVKARAEAAHPDDDGSFTCIIPKEKAIRIYAS